MSQKGLRVGIVSTSGAGYRACIGFRRHGILSSFATTKGGGGATAAAAAAAAATTTTIFN